METIVFVAVSAATVFSLASCLLDVDKTNVSVSVAAWRPVAEVTVSGWSNYFRSNTRSILDGTELPLVTSSVPGDVSWNGSDSVELPDATTAKHDANNTSGFVTSGDHHHAGSEFAKPPRRTHRQPDVDAVAHAHAHHKRNKQLSGGFHHQAFPEHRKTIAAAEIETRMDGSLFMFQRRLQLGGTSTSLTSSPVDYRLASGAVVLVLTALLTPLVCLLAGLARLQAKRRLDERAAGDYERMRGGDSVTSIGDGRCSISTIGGGGGGVGGGIEEMYHGSGPGFQVGG